MRFDKKNAEDLFKVSKAINDALAVIRENRKMAPSQTNLSKISGIHRNILRNGDVQCEESKSEKEHKLLGNTIDDLKKKLALSREEAAHWFHKTIVYETEIEALKALREKLDGQQKAMSELRKSSHQSHISTLIRG